MAETMSPIMIKTRAEAEKLKESAKFTPAEESKSLSDQSGEIFGEISSLLITCWPILIPSFIQKLTSDSNPGSLFGLSYAACLKLVHYLQNILGNYCEKNISPN